MAIKNVVTMGYGSFSGVNFIPTLGFGNFSIVAGPYRVAAKGVYIPGGRQKGLYQAGSAEQEIYLPGSVRKGNSQ